MCLKDQSLDFWNDLFFFLKDVGICNFADNTTTYISDESLENVLKSHEKNSMLAICWFEDNYMKLNTDKCCLIVSQVINMNMYE